MKPLVSIDPVREGVTHFFHLCAILWSQSVMFVLWKVLSGYGFLLYPVSLDNIILHFFYECKSDLHFIFSDFSSCLAKNNEGAIFLIAIVSLRPC